MVGVIDRIVDTPSVSDSTLTTGQIFTLQATVRNQGSSLMESLEGEERKDVISSK